MTSEELGAAVVSTLDHLAKVVPSSNREDVLAVLAHIMSGALHGKSPKYVASYFLKITKMLDGEFDR